MKHYIIRGAREVEFENNYSSFANKNVRAKGEDDEMVVSDGYHTMDELYDHRIALFIALCRRIFDNLKYAEYMHEPEVWRAQKHDDGTMMPGWFILGIGKEKGKQITYHLPQDRWDEVSFAETLEKSPAWDGHSSEDVLERLKIL